MYYNMLGIEINSKIMYIFTTIFITINNCLFNKTIVKYISIGRYNLDFKNQINVLRIIYLL